MNVKPLIVKVSGEGVAAVGVGMGNAALPIARAVPEGRSEIGIPDTVIAGAPGMIVWPLRIRSELGPRVTVKAPIVKVSGAGVAAVGTGNVELPTAITIPEGRREMGVPEIIRAGPPGVIVCPLSTRLELGSRVSVKPPIVRMFDGNDFAASPG